MNPDKKKAQVFIKLFDDVTDVTSIAYKKGHEVQLQQRPLRPAIRGFWLSIAGIVITGLRPS